MIKFTGLILSLIIFIGCSTAASPGIIGMREQRRYLVLNRATQNEAQQYANQYNASVLYTESRGGLADAVTSGITATAGPSRAMKHLMNELRTMSNTSGEWEIFIPKVSERYFLVTLRNMEDGAVSGSSGKVRLVESTDNAEIESEVARVLGSGFSVVYSQ